MQDKGDRPYFRAVTGLSNGQVYVSAIELNREHGQIEVPHRPTIRVGMLVSDSTLHPRAMIVINADASLYFSAIKQALGKDKILFVTNDAGDYLAAPDSSKTFGFDLGHRYRLQDYSARTRSRV